ncbi:hypothetical protein F5Y14DRAFT_220526 [Nemania sp. NC0429]|nr:hypothetical protein F5Y14DRAFT_220526 [Nemania sp. NC0429]
MCRQGFFPIAVGLRKCLPRDFQVPVDRRMWGAALMVSVPYLLLFVGSIEYKTVTNIQHETKDKVTTSSRLFSVHFGISPQTSSLHCRRYKRSLPHSRDASTTGIVPIPALFFVNPATEVDECEIKLFFKPPEQMPESTGPTLSSWLRYLH